MFFRFLVVSRNYRVCRWCGDDIWRKRICVARIPRYEGYCKAMGCYYKYSRKTRGYVEHVCVGNILWGWDGRSWNNHFTILFKYFRDMIDKSSPPSLKKVCFFNLDFLVDTSHNPQPSKGKTCCRGNAAIRHETAPQVFLFRFHIDMDCCLPFYTFELYDLISRYIIMNIFQLM